MAAGVERRFKIPIRGFTVALIFGVAASPLLTLVVIPVLYYAAQTRILQRTAIAAPPANAD